MRIPDTHIIETGIPCRLAASISQSSGGHWQIQHIKLGMKGQQTVRNIWIKESNKSGDGRDLFGIDVSGHQ